MLDACEDIQRFLTGRVRKDLGDDRMLLLALVKSIELVGEAANKVSSSAQDESSSIPWRDIISMRNRLIHGYYDIDHEIVWKTVTQEIPPLALELAQILSTEPSN
jgi:uncharacterized protein with HEPN domain